ncbi:transposase, partial [Mycobacterium tuberculosis]
PAGWGEFGAFVEYQSAQACAWLASAIETAYCAPPPVRRDLFDALGAERAAQITHVSADAADWIADVVTERCPDAIQCADPFHVVAWATEALDVERRRAWNDGTRDR